MRQWTEIAVTLPADAADALGAVFVELGSPGVIEEEAGEGRVRLCAHFGETEAREAVARVRRFLEAGERYFPGCATAALETATVAEEDWAEGWKQGFPPLAIGRRLYVRPPWAPAANGRLDIVIEPAMAFGTGQHATTAGCLALLEEVFDRAGPLSPVLDVGTGSGILAIAAARLGATRVVAVDDDPIAAEAARANVARNGLEAAITVSVGSAESVAGRFPLLLANLYSGLLHGLLPVFAARAAEAAWLIASGFLDADREALVAAARAHGFVERGGRSTEGWATVTFER